MALRRVAIRVLGRLEVVHDGAVVELPASKKTRAMLAYLVVTRRAHTRQSLCELLWDTPDDPRAALRWTLWKLRPIVNDEATSRLVATRDSVAFEAHGAVVDLAEVRRSLASGVRAATTDALITAAAAFRGELLEGLELDDCHRWHQWYLGEREALRRRHLEILEELTARLGDRPDQALKHARALLAIEPHAERAHLTVMKLLERLGRNREAIAQYDAWARTCATELGARVSPMALAWRTQLRAAPVVRANESSAPPAPTPPRGTIDAHALVGRAHELSALDAFVMTRAPSVIALVGEPGIGKTRLLDELAQRAERAGQRVLRARAIEAERRRPYGPWIAMLGEEVLERARGANDRAALWSAVTNALTAVAGSARPLVIMDDLHWVDEDSAALLHHVVRLLGADARFAFAVGFRPGELGDNVPCLRVVRALSREEHVLRVELGPLDSEATERLAKSIRHDVDGASVARESNGNPLFAIELARSQKASSGVPSALEDVIEARLAELDDGANQALSWLATFGRDVDADVLAQAMTMSPAEVSRSLERLERWQLVLARGIAWGFAHELIERVTYARISAPRRRVLHGAIARTLERHDEDGVLAGEVARHAALGGDARLAANASARAGERCLRVFAYASAQSLFDLGMREAERLPIEVRIPLQVRLYGLVVHPAIKLRDRGALSEPLIALAREAGDCGLDAERSRALTLVARVYFHSWEDVPRARAALAQAVRVVERDPSRNTEALLSGLRCLALVPCSMSRVGAELRSLAKLGERVTSSRYYQWAIGLVCQWEGDLHAARDALRSAIETSRRLGDHWAEYECLSALAGVELERGDAPEAARVTAELEKVAARFGTTGSEKWFAAAMTAVVAHDFEALDHAISQLDRVEATLLATRVRSLAAEEALARNDLERARHLAEAACSSAKRLAHAPETAAAFVVLGRIRFAAGDHDGATGAFADASALGDELSPALRAKVPASRAPCPS